ncbi:MAG: hypothetical protein JWM74_258 [Myxococcaceae bacterium]|nr:hypothetical protein [Myxococcaceae bacterium]
MSIPTVRRMVMFKHGVAYIERGGPADGSFELSFKKDEMNDVLKSLAVWVAKGNARVGAVAFEKPEDPEEALAARKLDLPPGGALVGLLRSLRGRKIVVKAHGECHEGEVVGVETRASGDGAEARTLLLRTGAGSIALVDLTVVQGVELLEDASRADLAFLVDRTRASTAGENRTVHVNVTGQAEDLRVAYVVPAPTWRVSYRLVREGADTVVTAWGIVHNPADEDLDELELTLTTGQPVSFMIDLYNPKNVHRVTVEETSRALASAPTRFERAPMARSYGGPPAAPAPMMMSPMAGMAPEALYEMDADEDAAPTGRGLGMMEMAAGATDASSYADRGELFEYRVASKISLKRGGSAMVPLFASKPQAKKERIWRDGSPAAPDLVLSFKNETGAVLEEGPAVIYDESVYAGEAMVPYSARGVEVKLAFAKDLGVRCKRESSSQRIVQGLRLGENGLYEEIRRESHHELSAESDHEEEIDVVFELPKLHGHSIDPAHVQPFEDTASFWRFRVVVPPHGRGVAKVVQRWHESQRTQYDHLTGPNLHRFLEQRFLDQATFDALSEVLATWNEARDLEARRQGYARFQQESYTKQKKISEQLAVLKEGGPEGNLRLRYVKELEAEQDKINQCEAEQRRLQTAIDEAHKRAATQLHELTTRR